MVSLSRCLGFVTVIVLMVSATSLFNGSALALIDAPSLVVVAVGTLAVMMIGADWQEWSDVRRVLLCRGAVRDTVALASAARWLRLASVVSLSTGAAWSAVFLIDTMGDVPPSKLPNLISIGLLGVLYGGVLSLFVLYPLAHGVESMLVRESVQGRKESRE